jgi:hypothetical protein
MLRNRGEKVTEEGGGSSGLDYVRPFVTNAA